MCPSYFSKRGNEQGSVHWSGVDHSQGIGCHRGAGALATYLDKKATCHGEHEEAGDGEPFVYRYRDDTMVGEVKTRTQLSPRSPSPSRLGCQR